MALNLRKVQVYEKVGKRQELALVAEHNIVRVRAGNDGPLFVQDGQVYSEGGQLIAPIPDWFWGEYTKVSPAMKKEVGLAMPGDAPAKVEAVAPAPTTQLPTKECPECNRVVKKTAYGLHIARHRKEDKVSV